MDCKDAEKAIHRFIDDEMETKELESFIKHMKSCESCREEMAIQFLVSEGMQFLEDGSAFDLQRELDKKMEDAQHKIRIVTKLRYLSYVIEVFAVISIVALIILVYIF